ncbi:unnamed protein product [Vicia faba]|uniref:Uncharacterized protein n=1 Tax=Vicia faba TaxID=3906 RepID=A0AAV0YZ39_VICFA|nr:unnamed protein product [Vicia faba]
MSDGKLSKQSSKKSSQSQNIYVMSHKVIHQLLVDSLKWYHENFLNKPVDPEYYVDATSKVESREKILKQFANHNLLKFIGMSKKFNHYHVNAFYCNLELTTVGLKSGFNDSVVKFSYGDFTKKIGLTSSGSSIIDIRDSSYDIFHFVFLFPCRWLRTLLFMEINGIVSKEDDLFEARERPIPWR